MKMEIKYSGSSLVYQVERCDICAGRITPFDAHICYVTPEEKAQILEGLQALGEFMLALGSK